MKLKNKKTGEIVEWEHGLQYKLGKEYNSIKEFAEEWEDYEEPKEYWAIDCFSPDGELISQFGKCSEKIIKNRKQIGNYFETKEEAEKAVEKLKAWKRLRDKGFRLNHWKEAQLRPNMSCVAITGNMKLDEEAKADLDLLFCPEENI